MRAPGHIKFTTSYNIVTGIVQELTNEKLTFGHAIIDSISSNKRLAISFQRDAVACMAGFLEEFEIAKNTWEEKRFIDKICEFSK